jgi:hypothetical protein
MDIERLNKRHSQENDMYYKVGFGLSSRLLSFRNGVFSLEIVIGKKWCKDYNSTAIELAHVWKKTHDELSFEYKKDLIKSGIKPGYDARKGVIFNKDYLN